MTQIIGNLITDYTSSKGIVDNQVTLDSLKRPILVETIYSCNMDAYVETSQDEINWLPLLHTKTIVDKNYDEIMNIDTKIKYLRIRSDGNLNIEKIITLGIIGE
jgi:hypothetical protein